MRRLLFAGLMAPAMLLTIAAGPTTGGDSPAPPPQATQPAHPTNPTEPTKPVPGAWTTTETPAIPEGTTLTCSTIATECFKECAKQATGPFCESYCGETKNVCMKTGRWDGMVHQFTEVEKR
ncbi:MAG: hypothetical protein AAGC70_20275 [Pseudomonadota bacterium]